MPEGQSALKQMRDSCNHSADRIDETANELGEAKGHPDCGAHPCMVRANFANSAGTAMVLRSKAFDYEQRLEEIDDKRKVYVGVATKVASSAVMGLFTALAAILGLKVFVGF